MLELCRPIADAHPGVATFQIGDAEALPAADGEYDAVILGFCLLHLPDPAKALSEAYRVLKPGGKVAYSVWESPGRGNLAFHLVLDAIEKHGDASRELPGAPLPFFHFADAQNASDALVAAGFEGSSVEVQTIPSVAALADPSDLYHMFANATARTRALLEMQTPSEQAAIQEAMAAGVVSKCSGTWYAGSNRSPSWLPAVAGTDAPLFDGRPTGRQPFQVAMPCVVASATKPASKQTKPAQSAEPAKESKAKRKGKKAKAATADPA
jgi:hypothetical protein